MDNIYGRLYICGIQKLYSHKHIHTVHEKAIIKEEVVDTSDIQSFATDFIKTYYTWENNREYMYFILTHIMLR